MSDMRRCTDLLIPGKGEPLMQRHLGQEKGHVLVLVALLLTFVLLPMVALAVDGGHLYAERRRMQNAADAGALAGAHVLCFGSGTEAAARAAAIDYTINRNNAEAAIVDIEESTKTVYVTASINTNTYFAGIFGMTTVPVAARSAAACGRTPQVCGVMPLAFNLNAWEKINCGQTFYVWDDTVGEDLCEKCECDEMLTSSASVGPAHRGWLNLPSPPEPYLDPYNCGGTCGTSSLKCWIENGYSGPLSEGDCVPGDPGVIEAARHSTRTRIGDKMYIVIWDGTCSPTTVGTCPGTGYRVVTLGYIEIVDVLTITLDPKEGYSKSDCPSNAKIIVARRDCGEAPASECGYTPGGAGQINAVSLIPFD
jgi:Flp pilus assembly protein TadG